MIISPNWDWLGQGRLRLGLHGGHEVGDRGLHIVQRWQLPRAYLAVAK